MVDENTLHQIWRLTNELAIQQSANKETLNSITTQMSDVKVSDCTIDCHYDNVLSILTTDI
jgi:hypothetical protein